MSKRFIDYYLEAVTKKSGGGGGPTIESKTITENGTYQESGKAYSPVTVNVAPKLQQRNVTVTDNGTTVIRKTSSAYDGISQVNLTVDVQGGGSTLVPLSDIVNQNGQYTAMPPEGADGFSDVSITVDVPTGGGDVVTVYKKFTPSVVDEIFSIDLSADAPQNKSLVGFIIRPASGTWGSIASGGGRDNFVYYSLIRDIDSNRYWFKNWSYKSASSTMSTPQSGGTRGYIGDTVQPAAVASSVVYDETNKLIKIYAKMVGDTTTNFGFASYCPYELFAFYK